MLPNRKVRTREGVRIRLVHKSTIAIVKSLRRNSVQLFFVLYRNTNRTIKGGLIQESFFPPPKNLPNHYPEHYQPKKILGQYFGGWSQSENLSEIKPSLPFTASKWTF